MQVFCWQRRDALTEKYDLIVLGAGPAGETGALKVAQFGKRVALIERAPYLGGAGINTGTVPSKTLRESALYFSGLQQRGLFGIDYSLKENISIKDFMYRERLVVEKERKMIGQSLRDSNVMLIHGDGALKDVHTVRVKSPDGDMEIYGETILIATGSSPHHPAEFPFDEKLVFDSDSILRMNRVPKTMAVVGGGVIGTEYASIFTALGVAVTLIEPRNRIVPFVDAEVGDRLTSQLTKLGLKFIFNDGVTGIEARGGHIQLSLKSGVTQKYDVALIASGRQSNVQGLGLEEIGVKLGNRGLVMVNDVYQTNIPTIYAAGDVIGFPALASTSMEQARVAMSHAFKMPYREHMSSVLPFAVYSVPEISMVGLTEEECKTKNIPYLVGRAYYEENARGQIIGDMSGMVKLIFSPADKKILGAHIIGEQASELIHVAAQVVMKGGTLDTFIEAVYNYPTLASLYEQAAYDGLANYQE